MKKRGLIVHFSDFTLPGGVNKVVSESLEHLSGIGISVDLAQPFFPSGDFYGDFKLLDECVTGKIGLIFNVEKFVKRIEEVTKKYDYTFVVIHGHLTTASHRIAARIKRNVGKVILHPHYDNYVETMFAKPLFPIFNRIIRFTSIKNYDEVIVGSEFERDAFTKDVGRSNITVIPLGIDIEPNSRNRNLTENIEMVYCGHLLNRKRIDITIRILSELTKIDKLKPRLKIIGEGGVKRRLIQLSEDLNVSHLIEWRGFLPKGEMLSEMSKSDFFMLFSESEAFAITVAECLALGTPCILADKTALSEHACEDGSILVKYPVNPENVAQKMKSMVGGELKVGLSGKRVKPWKAVIEGYSKVYIR